MVNNPSSKVEESPNAHGAVEGFRPRRPLSLRIIFWMFALWVILGWLRFGGALADYVLLREILPTGLYWYLVMAGFAYGIAGIPALWGIARRARWTWRPLVSAAIFYPALYWFERLLLWRDPTAQRNWPFMVILTLLWFGILISAVKSQGVRRFFNQKKVENKDGL